MAERRMFAKTIIDSDAFLDMPMSAQCLYFHLSMRADDDGFVNNPRKIQRMVGASEDDAKILMAKRFIIAFDSGVVVIKHWWIHNYIQKDRYKPTAYVEEKNELQRKTNGAYTLKGSGPSAALEGPDQDAENGMDTECIQDVSNPDTQSRLGKDRLELGKVRLGKDRDNARAREAFAAFADSQADAALTDALTSWLDAMEQTGRPLDAREQGAILDKLRAEFRREEWVPAIRRSAEKRWRSVFPRSEDRKAVQQEKQKQAWAEMPPKEETDRLIRLTEQMNRKEGGDDE